jgi:hypothetical protein
MKPYFAIFFACLFSLPLVAQDDPNEPEPFIRAAIIGGMNVSQVDGDGIAGFRKFGANGGAAAFVDLTKGFSASFEILYSMRGAKSSPNQTATGQLLNWNLDYIEVPFMVNYNDRDKAIFGVGVSWNTLVRNEAKGLLPDQRLDAKRASLDIVGGVTFLIKKRYGINFRYSYSLTSAGNFITNTSGGLQPTLEGGKLRNNVVGLRFMYFIN